MGYSIPASTSLASTWESCEHVDYVPSAESLLLSMACFVLQQNFHHTGPLPLIHLHDVCVGEESASLADALPVSLEAPEDVDTSHQGVAPPLGESREACIPLGTDSACSGHPFSSFKVGFTARTQGACSQRRCGESPSAKLQSVSSEDCRTQVLRQAVKQNAEMRSSSHAHNDVVGKVPCEVAENIIRRPENTSLWTDNEAEF